MEFSTVNATLLLSLFIAIIIVFYVFCCGVRLWSIASSLQSVCKQLEQFDVNEVNERYEDIKNVFENNSNIKNIWKTFEKTLVKTEGNNFSHKMYSTVEADTHFNLDNICSDISMWFWQNIGGIFTGAGILGTFWGLSEGLTEININDTSAMQDSIGELLSGLSTAFDTSLIGITAALLFSFVHKILLDRVVKNINKIVLILENLFQRRTTEQILADLYLESRQQTMQFEIFNSDLAIGIGDALEQKLSNSNLAESLKSIDYNIDSIRMTMKDELVGMIESAIDAKMVPVFVKLEESINKLSNSGVEAIAQGLKDGAGKEIAEFAGVLKLVGEKMDASLQNMVDTSNAVNNELVNAIGNAIAELNGSMQSIAKQYEDVETHMDDTIKASIQKMEDVIERINKQTVIQTENMAASTDVVSQGLLSAVENIKVHLDEVTKEYSTKNKEMNDMVLEQVKSIQNSISAHEKAIDEINKQIMITLDSANKAANAFKDAAIPVSHASTQLEVQMNNCMVAVEKHYTQTNDSINLLTQLNSETNKNAQNLMAEFDLARKDITSVTSKYHNMNNELANVLDTINRYLDNYNKQVNEGLESILKQYDESVGQTCSYLAGLLEELKDELADRK